MYYFYAMQKPIQQLDLFGMPVEQVAPSVKKKQLIKEKVVDSLPVIAEPMPDAFTAPVFDQAITPVTDPIVFADERIVVKIKAKAPAPITVELQQPEKPANAADNNTRQVGKRGRKSFREMDTEIDLIDVPDEETLNQKLYYSISEVAGWFKVNTSLLRYWENEFDVLQPRKTRKGDRLFRVEDIKNLQLIYFLLRQRKFSIEGARNYLKQNKGQVDVQLQLVQSLTKFKSFLLELKAGLGN